MQRAVQAGNTATDRPAYPMLTGESRPGAELTTPDAIAAQTLAEVTAEAIHELRNALAAVAHQVELLQFELPGEIGVERTNLILRSVDAGANILNRLRQVTRPVSREEAAVDANQVLRDVAELTHFRWARAEGDTRPRVSVELDLHEVPAVRGNVGELLQVFTNLVINACEALTEGGTIRLCSRWEGRHVLLSVADDGPGMTAETRETIFRRHFSTKQGENSGLGLSIVADIIRRHGGHVLVNSSPGRGTTFYVSLHAHGEGDEEDGEGKPQPRAPRILVVEDEVSIRESLRQFLIYGGYEVACAATGEAALELLPSGFDLLLTDLALGGITGYEVARSYRRLQPAGRCILLTGWHNTGQGAAGIDMVLTKPVRGQALLNAVQGLLQASPGLGLAQ